MGPVMGFGPIPDRWAQRLELHDTTEKIALDLYRARTGAYKKELNLVYGSMGKWLEICQVPKVG